MKRKMIFCIFLMCVTGIFIAAPAFSQELILQDSAQELCYNWDSIICSEWDEAEEECLSPYCPEPGEDFYGQDGTYTINPPDLTDNGDGTIKDNLTGLTWEQKSEEGEAITYTYTDAVAYCENLVLGGSDDWRMPARPEYSTLLNYNVISPALDQELFPYYNVSTSDDASYWTTSDYHDDTSQAWRISIPFGLINYASKTGIMSKIRCVTGDPLPASKFVDNGDGTVTDLTTGLMWEQKTDDGSSRDKDNARTWNESMKYCESLELSDYTDWRLPNTKELERIVDLEKSKPAVDTQYFPNTENAIYWSGTSCAGCHKFKALSIDYTDGELYFGVKFRDGEYHENHERCVRTADLSYSGTSCPISSALRNNVSQLTPFCVVRDSLLAKSTKGREYILKYYEHAAEVTQIMLFDSTIKKQVTKILIKVLPSLTTTVSSGTVTVSQKIVPEIEGLLVSLEKHSSLPLKKTIQGVRNDLQGNTLFNQLGVVIR